MHKEYLEQAIKRMQSDLFNVIKTKIWNGKEYSNGQTAKNGYIRAKGFTSS